MKYREYRASAVLAPVVDCVWTLEGHASDLGDHVQPVLPEGRSELIVHFGDPFERVHPDGAIERQAATIFAGQITSQLVLRPTGRISVLGVRLHADGGAALSRIPQSDLAGRTLPADDVSRPLARVMAEIRNAGGPAAAVEVLEHGLANVVDADRIDPRVRHVVSVIRRRRGRLSIDAAASQVGLTRRHLERRFGAGVGMSPKRLTRIARFQQALQWLEGASAPMSGALTAAACGYADQAHFIRDFHDLAGCPPTAHLVRRAELSGFFSRRSS